MSDNVQRIQALFQRYLQNTITASEYQELLDILHTDTLSEDLSLSLQSLWNQSADNPAGLPDNIWDQRLEFLLQQINEEKTTITPVRTFSARFRWHWAAAILLLVAAPVLYYLLKNSDPATINTLASENKDTTQLLMPGDNRAVLTLADGSSIVLDSSSNGTIASQGTAKIIKLSTGQLAYDCSNKKPGEVLYNTLSTPRGGQYQVKLEDGTLVWLNSASSLRYPTAFKGADRRVEITGEAYFEVAKQKGHPFKVQINLPSGTGGEVEVLGTHFNINAFEDESAVRTTLLEGSIKMNFSSGQAIKINPGQQLKSDKYQKTEIISHANLEETIAWKEGKFHFEDADIKYVMRQIARWYDLNVEYKGNIERHFAGTISKQVDAAKVLDMLELTGEVHFKTEGKKVTVMP